MGGARAAGEGAGEVAMDPLGAATVQVVAQAVVRAALQATGLGGVPAAKELSFSKDPIN